MGLPMQGAFPHGRLGLSRQTEVAPGFRLRTADEFDPWGLAYVRMRESDIVSISSDGLRYVHAIEYLPLGQYRNVLIPAPGALCEMTFPG